MYPALYYKFRLVRLCPVSTDPVTYRGISLTEEKNVLTGPQFLFLLQRFFAIVSLIRAEKYHYVV